MWVNATTNLLVPDVILNHCERILADRRDEIAVRPEIRLPVVLLKDRFPVHLHDHELLLPEDIADRAVYDLLNAASQDRVPVLCHQHHMVLQQEAALKKYQLNAELNSAFN